MSNEYLELVEASVGARIRTMSGAAFDFDYRRWRCGWDARAALVRRFAWAIPNDEAVATLVRYSPLVEVGAGTGYWAKLVREAGGVIHPYDAAPPGISKNAHGHKEAFVRVKRGGPKVLDRFDETHNLFLCWPPYDETMADRCLRRFRGRFLVYVGEQEGCTADEGFRERVGREWVEREEVRIPNWEGIHDALWVYERRAGAALAEGAA